MKLGIEKIGLYAGSCFLDIDDLVAARDGDLKYVKKQLMCEERPVYPVYEDAVTMAVNAASKIIVKEDIPAIDLLIVGTESGVDFGKPISTWVHRYCGLSNHCRSFEVKHACYSLTGALKMALAWLSSSGNSNKKVLVVGTDLSRTHIGSPLEYISGGCSIAMLVSASPSILEIDLDKSGYFTSEVADTFRPTSKHEIANSELSMCSYLDSLEGAYNHFNGKVSINSYAHFKKHIYHLPFPGMAFYAHKMMLENYTELNRKQIDEDFIHKVSEGLGLSKRIGSAYGCSNFVSLLSLLASSKDIKPKDEISLYSYGSGCQGEFYSAQIADDALDYVTQLNLFHMLDARVKVGVDAYEIIENERVQLNDKQNFSTLTSYMQEDIYKHYKENNYLILDKVEDYQRFYKWAN